LFALIAAGSLGAALLTTAAVQATSGANNPAPNSAPQADIYKIIGWNDLGMHCMNESFANLAVLPPYNTLWAQVIRQGPEPDIVTSGVTVEYSIVDNTYSAGKTNFWQYARQLFGVDLAPNVGLTGATLAGQMHVSGDHFVVEGVPLTPYRDSAPQPGPQNWYPYQLAHLVVRDSATGQVLAETTTVAPVSTEMRCDTCHGDGMQEGIATGNVETNILTLHDREEETNLMGSRPVLCATCHASNALGAPGKPNIPNLSRAMHNKHAPENNARAASFNGGALSALFSQAGANALPAAVASEGTNNCYLCHPGQQTQCLRDVMYQKGLTCTSCHGGTADVANPARRPWIDEPRCGACHAAQYAENSGKRYRDSVGHGGLYCEACHGSPHAILPSTQPNDNIQNIALQGHAGTLSDCTVCHASVPAGAGPHGLQPNVTPTATTTAGVTPTRTATATRTAAPTETGTVTRTVTPTRTPQPSETPEPSETPKPTHTVTVTGTPERRQIEFTGVVQTRPANRIGAWQIGGRTVIVTASTRFDESKGPAVVGATVQVKGYQETNGQVSAQRIKTESASGPAEPTVKWIGVIESLPGGDLVGVWQVGGQAVTVSASTQLHGDHAAYVLGARVKVRARTATDGVLVATDVELYQEDLAQSADR
jgi:hypothetical protein